MLLTHEDLDSLEKGAGDGVLGVIDVQALAPATSQTAAGPTLHGASVQG